MIVSRCTLLCLQVSKSVMPSALRIDFVTRERNCADRDIDGGCGKRRAEEEKDKIKRWMK